jgi:tetratricopeptide (TPR) repeat protein/tRNA A-37 threonylcarbamoyl transferase component Bud32
MDDIRSRFQAALGDLYRFDAELGGGGMSRTYLAEELALHRRVVVKVLAPELLAGISVERFRREVLLAAQLQHPHVVPVLSTGEVDGLPWFTMPYVDGQSLRQRLATGRMPVGEAVHVLRDVARALAYAHAQGIVHRDIKPDNVLLAAGSATVTDFGIAKAISAARTGGTGGEALTQVGTSIGTPTYMAPEQAAGDPATDHRADIYAFGVMAFEMLTGRPPFVATSPTRLLAAHLSESPPELLGLREDCPPALAALVMRCLAKEPDQRPQEAVAMAQVLDAVTPSGSGSAVPEVLQGAPIPLGRALALWAVAAVVVGVTAWAAREVIGLPDWVLPGAVGVMLAGLPVLLVTAYVQRTMHRVYTRTPTGTAPVEGTMATLAMRASPHLSWRRAWLGGAIAVGGFALLIVGFMVLRAMGVGPMASLRGSGAFGSHEMLMIADFRSPPSDSTLGGTVAEALRTDLAQSTSLNVLTRSSIREALTLMQRPADAQMTFDLAREIATREGAKAVLDGGISQFGQSYVISARLVSALDGSDLAVFREEAANEDALLDALGRLSKEIRAKAGESLKAIRASNALERVTTPSLPALRKYVEGSRLSDEEGENERGLALLREAVQLDTAFAMAWRKIAVLLNNEGQDEAGMIAAISTAYRHRDRLTDMERLLTEGFYFTNGPITDRAKALAAYEDAAKLDTLSTAALNNAAVLFGAMNDHEKAESFYRRVVKLPHTFGGAFTNLLQEQIVNGRSPAALDSTVARYRERFGQNNDFWEAEWYAAWGKGDLGAADSVARVVNTSPRTMRQSVVSSQLLSSTMELQGRIAEARAFADAGDHAVYRAQPSPANLIQFAIDSAYFEMQYGTKAAALAVLDRGFARVPMNTISPSNRPWQMLSNLGAILRDPQLVRDATTGWERDQIALANDSVGGRARYASQLAYAEGRWSEAIAATRVAEERFEMEPRVGALYRGYSFQALGNPDSAIVSYRRFLELRTARAWYDAPFRADVLQRLGGLYEAQGDVANAIEYYNQFTAQWAHADAALQPRVREIHARVVKLQAEAG